MPFGLKDPRETDSLKQQFANALDRYAQNEMTRAAILKDRQEQAAVSSILKGYEEAIAPRAIDVATTPERPTTAEGQAIAGPLQPQVSQRIVTPGKEVQFEAARQAISRLSGFGQRGLKAASQITDLLGTYAKMFPRERPQIAYGQPSLRTLDGGVKVIEEKGIDITTGQPVPGVSRTKQVTGRAGSRIKPEESATIDFFKYDDPANPEMPTGVRGELLTPKYRETLKKEYTSQIDKSQTQIAKLEKDISGAENGVRDPLTGILTKAPDPALAKKLTADLEQEKKDLAVAKAHMRMIRAASKGSFDKPQGYGGTTPMGAGMGSMLDSGDEEGDETTADDETEE